MILMLFKRRKEEKKENEFQANNQQNVVLFLEIVQKLLIGDICNAASNRISFGAINPLYP